ncbi:MAG: carboxypeptidase regulatory-like domain-containing protein [Candidatus Omnitrophica bacterium]|nr:carboxypeptidase regulatory-like domain-containing protein [Candidatus Omnitrophota bacterium]
MPTIPITLDQKGCQYHPHVLGVQVGQPFEMVNSDPTLHNIHSLAEKSAQFNLGMPIENMRLKKKFENPEIMVKLKCDVHPWMSAYIGVLSHPFFSVSGSDGAFEIKDLPAGEYTIEAWHEKYGTQTQKITVGEESATADFTFNG